MCNPVLKSQVTRIVYQTTLIRNRRSKIIKMLLQAISLFKEYESPKYYNARGRKIKRPLPSHVRVKGRYNQKNARTVLISGLARAWLNGTGKKATVSKKNERDSSFVIFATDIFHLIGIGNIHKHLEEYTSIRKASLISNELLNKSDSTK